MDNFTNFSFFQFFSVEQLAANMTNTCFGKKNLIIHVEIEQDPKGLKTILDTNALYKKYEDGWESTMEARGEQVGVRSTRYYYYFIPHSDLTKMVRFLHTNKGERSVKVRISTDFNRNFD